MGLKAEEYVAKLEGFLAGIGVTGTHFCERQYQRWRGLVREAFEEADSNANTDTPAPEKLDTKDGNRRE